MLQRKRSSSASLPTGEEGEEGSPKLGGRRQELVDAAANIFAEKGYHATSVQDIASELGILKGSIYYYIDSKEDLLYDIVRRRLDGIESLLARLRTPDLDAVAKLRGFIGGSVEHVQAEPVQSAVLVRDMWALTGVRLDSAVKVIDKQDRFLRRQVVTGQKDGVVCPDADPALVATAILSMVAWTHRRLGKSRRSRVEGMGEAFADLVLAGVVCTRTGHSVGHRGQLGALPAVW